MPKNINTGFTVNAPEPIDSRTRVNTYADLAGIPVKYESLKVYVLDEDKEYRYLSGNWVEVTIQASSVSWGSITGNILTQADLVNKFNEYALATHTHPQTAPIAHSHSTADIEQGSLQVTWDRENTAPNFILEGSSPSEVNPDENVFMLKSVFATQQPSGGYVDKALNSDNLGGFPASDYVRTDAGAIVQTFIDLEDTPEAFVANRLAASNAAGNAIEFTDTLSDPLKLLSGAVIGNPANQAGATLTFNGSTDTGWLSMIGNAMVFYLFSGGTHRDTLNISGDAILANALTNDNITAASDQVLITKGYADSTYTGFSYQDITWEDLAASGSRSQGQLYNITTAHPNTGIIYGPIILETNNSFRWTDPTTYLRYNVII